MEIALDEVFYIAIGVKRRYREIWVKFWEVSEVIWKLHTSKLHLHIQKFPFNFQTHYNLYIFNPNPAIKFTHYFISSRSKFWWGTHRPWTLPAHSVPDRHFLRKALLQTYQVDLYLHIFYSNLWFFTVQNFHFFAIQNFHILFRSNFSLFKKFASEI